MCCCTGEVVVESLESSCQCFNSFHFFLFLFFLSIIYLFIYLLCSVLFYLFTSVFSFTGVFWALHGLANILGWPYLVCALIVSWPSWVLLCDLSFFSLVFYLSTWLCFSSWEISILMGRILIRVLNFSLQTKSNPRIIYFCKIFNSPTGNYPKRVLNSLRIAKGIHSYWWVLPSFVLNA